MNYGHRQFLKGWRNVMDGHIFPRTEEDAWAYAQDLKADHFKVSWEGMGQMLADSYIRHGRF